jgi:hypothetical protein
MGDFSLVLWCFVLNPHESHAHLTTRRRWERNTNERCGPFQRSRPLRTHASTAFVLMRPHKGICYILLVHTNNRYPEYEASYMHLAGRLRPLT